MLLFKDKSMNLNFNYHWFKQNTVAIHQIFYFSLQLMLEVLWHLALYLSFFFDLWFKRYKWLSSLVRVFVNQVCCLVGSYHYIVLVLVCSDFLSTSSDAFLVSLSFTFSLSKPSLRRWRHKSATAKFLEERRVVRVHLSSGPTIGNRFPS